MLRRDLCNDRRDKANILLDVDVDSRQSALTLNSFRLCDSDRRATFDSHLPTAALSTDSPGFPINANIAPTFAGTPSSAMIFNTVPDAGAGISVSTLSVFTSRSGSSSLTRVAFLLEPLYYRYFFNTFAE